MTDCILGYGRLSISDDLSPEPIEVIRRGVKELERLEADRLPVGLAFLAWSSYMSGDFVSCADALDRYEEVLGQSGPQPPVVVEGVAILHAMAEMIVDVEASVLPVFDSTRIHSNAAVDWILAAD